MRRLTVTVISFLAFITFLPLSADIRVNEEFQTRVLLVYLPRFEDCPMRVFHLSGYYPCGNFDRGRG